MRKFLIATYLELFPVFKGSIIIETESEGNMKLKGHEEELGAQ